MGSFGKPTIPVADAMNWPKKCGSTSLTARMSSPKSTLSPSKGYIFILAVTVAAVALRLPRLQQRPMHGDEAVHAVRFGELLEKNFYRYNPHEYHGPTLNYFTLIPAWLSGIHKFKDLSEFTLRIVPVFFGLLLVLMPLLLLDGLGRPATIIAVVMTAISPAFVFYSRYYIQEMLLVCFTFGVITFGYRYTQDKNIYWALLTGTFLGLMHATKETCIISFGSMFLALLIVLLLQHKRVPAKRGPKDTPLNIVKTVKASHLIVGSAAAVALSAIFYSSFLTNPKGILDSVRTCTVYFSRSQYNSLHIHPWYYYLKMLIWSKYGDGPIWSEALIVLLAVVGLIVAIKGKDLLAVNFHLLRFIAFYTVIMTIIYFAIPYKTPWSMLGFLHGMILLAATGAVALIRLVPNILTRALIGMLLVAASAHLTWQAYLGSYKYYADARNPYVYAHPVTDVFDITQRIEEVALASPDGHNIYIQVICPAGDYWPLPWYLRSFPNIGWWNNVDENIPAAPLIIASPSVVPALMRKLYELPSPGKKNLYVPLFDSYTELRPQVELLGFVTKELWDRFQQHRAQPVQSQSTGER